jgi:phosphoserine phosphatase
MKIFFKPNESELDRFARAAIGLGLILLGIFGGLGWWRVALLAFGGIALFTAVSGFCGAYVLFGIDTRKASPKPLKPLVRKMWITALILFFIGGSVGGYLLNQKSFREDLASLNGAYKQVLYLSGQDSPQTVKYDMEFRLRLGDFQSRQLEYRPWIVRDNARLRTLFAELAATAQAAGDKVVLGQNQEAHLEFEKIRPLLQEIMRSAGISELAVALISFHDVMEQVVVAADQKDLAGVVAAYVLADGKLQEVEALAQDEEIQAIRQALDRVLEIAAKPEPDALPEAAAKLKSAFVKVYLSRG